uniref:Polygalacturonase (Fragments) n=1 Tax=Cupressus sempervirens TaxID=13469 RepID=PGLR_CUPSE|nr:RecName: Full=Polygalacturonase; AltName: Allergen=Cup s 2 [Cupressus sempervirens]
DVAIVFNVEHTLSAVFLVPANKKVDGIIAAYPDPVKIWMHFARTVCNDKGRPTAIKIDFSKSELTLMNSPEFHLVFGECDGVKIQGIKIKRFEIEKDLTCGPGHGMSIGSLGKGNSRSEVSFVHLDGAKFIDTQNGLRSAVKIEDVTFKNANGYYTNPLNPPCK